MTNVSNSLIFISEGIDLYNEEKAQNTHGKLNEYVGDFVSDMFHNTEDSSELKEQYCDIKEMSKKFASEDSFEFIELLNKMYYDRFDLLKEDKESEIECSRFS